MINELKDFEKSTNKLYYVLIKPKGLRQKLLRWLYPELVDVANDLRKCYWSGCDSCEGSGLAHDENGCEVDDVCEECTGSGSAVGEDE